MRRSGYGSSPSREGFFELAMNDSLHGLRLAISRKAVVFRGLRSAKSKTRRQGPGRDYAGGRERSTPCPSVLPRTHRFQAAWSR